MTFPFNVLLNWLPNPIWFSRRGTRHLSPFPWEKICWYSLRIRMKQFLRHITSWYPLINKLLFLFFNAFNFRWYLGRISPLHLAMLWSPDLVKCINAFGSLTRLIGRDQKGIKSAGTVDSVEMSIIYGTPQKHWCTWPDQVTTALPDAEVRFSLSTNGS